MVSRQADASTGPVPFLPFSKKLILGDLNSQKGKTKQTNK
jgi:hypothetical protein